MGLNLRNQGTQPEISIEDEEDKIQIGQNMADFGKAVNPNLPEDFVHEGLKRVYKPKDA